jgi:hypothetical protein
MGERAGMSLDGGAGLIVSHAAAEIADEHDRLRLSRRETGHSCPVGRTFLAIAGYSIYVAVVATATRHGKHYSPGLFWTAIGIFWAIGLACLWGAQRIYRRRFVKLS